MKQVLFRDFGAAFSMCAGTALHSGFSGGNWIADAASWLWVCATFILIRRLLWGAQ